LQAHERKRTLPVHGAGPSVLSNRHATFPSTQTTTERPLSMTSRRPLVVILLALLAALVCGRLSSAEKMLTPKWLLWQEPVVVDGTVLSIEKKPGPHAGSSIWHRVRIDRIARGVGLKVGEEVAVISRIYTTPPGTAGTSGHRGVWGGPNGLPTKGDRARIFASGNAQLLQPHFTNGWQPIEPSIAFVAADDEYRSELTMPFLAEITAKALAATTTIHLATDGAPSGGPNELPKVNAKTHLTGSTGLRWSADAIIAYMRFEQLDRSTLEDFLTPLEGGVPLVAFRTTTHAFAYPADSPHAMLNNSFGEKFLGTPWRFHHGHASKTRILPPDSESAKHPVLAGVMIPAEGIVVPSWLYHVEPLAADCTVLLWGEAIDSDRKDAPQKQPILWVRERAVDARSGRRATEKSAPATSPASGPAPRPQRIAVSTLGHPGDFANPEVRMIAVQMIAWAVAFDRALQSDECAEIRAATFSPPSIR